MKIIFPRLLIAIPFLHCLKSFFHTSLTASSVFKHLTREKHGSGGSLKFGVSGYRHQSDIIIPHQHRRKLFMNTKIFGCEKTTYLVEKDMHCILYCLCLFTIFVDFFPTWTFELGFIQSREIKETERHSVPGLAGH